MAGHLYRTVLWTLLGCVLGAASTPVAALSLGQIDNFQGASDAGWSAGLVSPRPPSVVANGGPAGVGDAYLSIEALAGVGAGSRLTVIAGPQWAGNYLGAGVERIELDANNLGGTAVDLRLYLLGPLGAYALSTNALALAPGSGWTHLSFSLLGAALTGQTQVTLVDVQQLRLFSSPTAVYPGPALQTTLGIDNVSAVPEPQAAWLLLPGLALLSAMRLRRT